MKLEEVAGAATALATSKILETRSARFQGLQASEEAAPKRLQMGLR